MIFFAQIGRLEWALAVPVAALLVALGLGVWVFLRMQRWRQEIDEGPSVTRQKLLEQYQRMLEEGDVDPEEFARIKASLYPEPVETGIQEKLPPETGMQAGPSPDFPPSPPK